ncbi:hypothetical protein EC968_000656 [Mortierella alpina]|nr:hypothetical protein EC968_000656 [Mortierella alpina]
MTAMLSLSSDKSLTAFAAPLTPLQPPEEVEAKKSPLEMWAAGLDDSDYHPEVVEYTDWSCKPTKEGANPIVLLHGLMAYPKFQSTAYMAEKFTQSGYCVYQLMYGMRHVLGVDYYGLDDITVSAEKELSPFVEKVLNATGASQVDLIGHSEGSVVARWYVKFLDENKRVRSVISVSPVGRGTTLQGLLGVFKAFHQYLEPLVKTYCPACLQLLQNSDLLNKLYEDDPEVVPGVQYLNILTREDQIVTPYTNGVMKLEDSPHVNDDNSNNDNSNSNSLTAEDRTEEQQRLSQNVFLEDYCPGLLPECSNHFALFRCNFAAIAAEAFLTSKKGGLLEKEDLPCTSS